MLFSDVFDRFVDESPICVMARGLMERALAPQCLDALFEKTAQRQYTRELLFSAWFNSPCFWVTGQTFCAAGPMDGFGRLRWANSGKFGGSRASPANADGVGP